MIRLIALLSILTLPACMSAQAASEPQEVQPPVMRWDHRPESDVWTSQTMKALREHGAALPALVPADIETWCPGYAEQSEENRAAFWTGLFSALAEYESTWRPDAVGGGGLWYGLVQIDPRTARAYGCEAKTGSALKDGAANLSCAVRIAASQVSKRGTVRRGMLDWGPFHKGWARQEMAAYTKAQPYCAKVESGA